MDYFGVDVANLLLKWPHFFEGLEALDVERTGIRLPPSRVLNQLKFFCFVFYILKFYLIHGDFWSMDLGDLFNPRKYCVREFQPVS